MIKYVVLFGWMIGLSGCALQSSVQGAYPTPDETAQQAAIGAVSGAAVGVASSSIGMPLGASIGGIMGGAYGMSHEMAVLDKAGVQAFMIGDNLTIILPVDRYFETSSPTLCTAGYPQLNEIAGFLKRYPDNPVHITVYADNVGSRQQTKTLTQQQAESLRTYFWVHGIPFQQLTAAGKGNQQPVSDNSYAAGSAANRRVEITLRLLPQQVHPQG